MVSFKNKKVLIFGLGIQGGGVGSAKFFCENGAKVKVTDLKTEKELSESLKKLNQYKVEYTLGGHKKEDFLWADLVIRNPDVPLSSPYLQFCFQNKIPVEMEESLFMKLCPVPVIGVTGTRGKSTTTFLIGEILKKAGYKTFLGGNIRGIATLSFLKKINKKEEPKVVLELSSWQLQSFGWYKISPHIAVITNIYPDHLNRYPSMENYINDKKNIFLFQRKKDFLVINGINKITKKIAKEAKSQVIFFSPQILSSRIIKIFSLSGEHNLENLAAAYSVSKILGIKEEAIEKAISIFNTLPFRQEIIREIDGVTYVNDSTSTTPIAGIMALKRFSSRPIILICGGNSKNLPMEDFINEMVKKVKKVILLKGTATDFIEKKLIKMGKGDKILGKFCDLKEAIKKAKKVAKRGDCILFSPAATSFSMFKNEFDRGEKFNQIIASF